MLRRLRALERAGRVHLEWTLGAAGALPRYERWASATAAGRAAAAGAAAPDGRPLGPRQRAAPRRAGGGRRPDDPGAGRRRSPRRHGAAGLARSRGAASSTSPRGSGRATRSASGPPGSGRLAAGGRLPVRAPRPRRWRPRRPPLAARDPTPLLIDGPTGAGKTAVYAEAIAASLAAGRPALVLVPEIALALPLVDRLRADLGAEVAVVHSGLGEGERADAWRRIRAGAVDVVVGTRIAILAPLADVGLVDRGRGARGDLQERPDAALSRPATWPSAWGRSPARP